MFAALRFFSGGLFLLFAGRAGRRHASVKFSALKHA